MTVLAPILVLGLVIAVHELGHFLAAKLAGVHVRRFSIGMGPALLRSRIGETDFVLSALPLGGYVRMASRFDATEGAGAPPPVPESACFEGKALPARLFVLLAGVAMNLLLALALFAGLSFGGHLDSGGAYAARSGPLESPALSELGIGSEIRAVNERPVETWAQVASYVTGSPGAVAITLEGGVAWLPSLRGHSHADVLDLLGGEACPLVDSVVVFAEGADHQSADVVGTWDSGGPPPGTRVEQALRVGSQLTWAITGEVAGAVRGLVVGEVSTSEIAGPIGIIRMSAGAAQGGLADVVLLTALLSVNLAVLNLLPVPVLDGGQITIAVLEAASGRRLGPWARTALTLTGVIFILLLLAFATFNDLRGLLPWLPAR